MDVPNKSAEATNEWSSRAVESVGGLNTNRSSALHMSLRPPRRHHHNNTSVRCRRLNAFLTLRQKDVRVLLHQLNNPSPAVMRMNDDLNSLTSARHNYTEPNANLYNDSSGIMIAAEIVVERQVETIAAPANRMRSCSFRNALEHSRWPDNQQDENTRPTVDTETDTSIEVDNIHGSIADNPDFASQRSHRPNTEKPPSSINRILECSFCTFGLFNMSRFAILGVHLGGNFILQFLATSILFGIPIFLLFVCIGSYIRQNSFSLRKISPICNGIGISAIIVQILVTIYSTIIVVWTLSHFNDAFINRDSSTSKIQNKTTVLATLAPKIAPKYPSNEEPFILFQSVFQVALVWFAVFVLFYINSKKSYRFQVTILVFEYLALFASCIKLITCAHRSKDIISVDWNNMYDETSWFLAAQETIMTWALFGATIISVFSVPQNAHCTNLKRDLAIVVALTIVGLVLSALFAGACVNILKPDIYFVEKRNYDVSPKLLTTELFPVTISQLTQRRISSGFWNFLTFAMFVSFGITQLYAMWIPVIIILRARSISVFISCVAAGVLTLPFATRCGAQIAQFFEAFIAGSWLVTLICLCIICALFLLRGRPYSADIMVKRLRLPGMLATCVALLWNIVCPIALVTLAILQFKEAKYRDVYRGSSAAQLEHAWPRWMRAMGLYTQLGILLIIPLTAAVQAYRYLSTGPVDIFDRIQCLVRPPERRPDLTENIELSPDAVESSETVLELPPMYTPPPSYSTATGARLARALRKSFRKSVRRIGLSSASIKNSYNERLQQRNRPAKTNILTRTLSLTRRANRTEPPQSLRRCRSFVQQ